MIFSTNPIAVAVLLVCFAAAALIVRGLLHWFFVRGFEQANQRWLRSALFGDTITIGAACYQVHRILNDETETIAADKPDRLFVTPASHNGIPAHS